MLVRGLGDGFWVFWVVVEFCEVLVGGGVC